MALTKRQKQIFDYVRGFIEEHGYSPSLEEIGRHFGLSSVATVHKHVTNLVKKGLLRRSWNQNRSIEVVQEGDAPRAVEIPLLGTVSADHPVAPTTKDRTLTVPSWLVGQGRTYALEVDDDSMLDDQIRDGDHVIVEERRHAEDGQVVVAMVHGEEAWLRRYLEGEDKVRLADTRASRRETTDSLPLDRVEIRGVVRGIIRSC